MTPERDLASHLYPVQAIDVGVLAADTVPAALDLVDYGAALILISIGIGGIAFTGANKIEFVLTHSDDNVTYTNVVDNDLVKDAFAPGVIVAGIVRSLTAAKAAADVQKLSYVGGKRYVKLQADFSGSHGTGTPISATIVRGRAAIRGAA